MMVLEIYLYYTSTHIYIYIYYIRLTVGLFWEGEGYQLPRYGKSSPQAFRKTLFAAFSCRRLQSETPVPEI